LYVPIAYVMKETIVTWQAENYSHFKKFRDEYMPWMIELGRSFVQPAYQTTSRNSKGLYALITCGTGWVQYG